MFICFTLFNQIINPLYLFFQNTEWYSLAAVAPWKRPEAIAVIEILGFDGEIDLPVDGTKFLLENVSVSCYFS